MNRSIGWLRRYRAGQRDQVWRELRQLGDKVRDPNVATEVQLVCDEMASRARQNVEAIVERLSGDGFRFHANDDERAAVAAHIPPTSNAAEHCEWLQRRAGDIPMTLSSWIRVVGDVWLVGTHPAWERAASADPLVIEAEGSRYPAGSMRENVDDELEQWNDMVDEDPHVGPFVLPLSPDHHHKDNVSGGPPYGIVLPDGCADGLFVADKIMPFVSYLNWVFRNGGFPRPTGHDPHSQQVQLRVTQALAEDLLPL